MKITVIQRVFGTAEVRAVVEARSFDEAVRIAYPEDGGKTRVLSYHAPSVTWGVQLTNRSNVGYMVKVWCRRATEHDLATHKVKHAV